MTISTPSLKPPLLKSIESDFGTSIASSLWKKVVDNLNWYNANVPIGLGIWFFGNQRLADGSPGTFITEPFTNEWIRMTGSVLNDSTSPLDGQTITDYQFKFVKHSVTSGVSGGSATVDISHNHSGTTGVTNDRTEASNLRSDDDDNEVEHGGPHSHPISAKSPFTFNTVTKEIQIALYIRAGGSLQGSPSLRTDGLFQGIEDEATGFGTLVSQELAGLILSSIDYLQKSIPIGMIAPIFTHITGVPTPDPNIWQVCDGSEITNINSPLRSVGGSTRLTPNLTGRYVRILKSLGASGTTFGSNTTTAFAHDHTGFTGFHIAPDGADTISDAVNTNPQHRHSLGAALTGAINVEPEFITGRYHIKIQ